MKIRKRFVKRILNEMHITPLKNGKFKFGTQNYNTTITKKQVNEILDIREKNKRKQRYDYQKNVETLKKLTKNNEVLSDYITGRKIKTDADFKRYYKSNKEGLKNLLTKQLQKPYVRINNNQHVKIFRPGSKKIVLRPISYSMRDELYKKNLIKMIYLHVQNNTIKDFIIKWLSKISVREIYIMSRFNLCLDLNYIYPVKGGQPQLDISEIINTLDLYYAKNKTYEKERQVIDEILQLETF